MRNRGGGIAALLGLLCGTACSATPKDPDVPSVPLAAPALSCLSQSLEGLRTEFNAHQDKPRLVTLLSPTCSPCELGTRAVRESILDAYPDAELRALVVWIDLLPGSTLEQAEARSIALADPRVTQFYDPKQYAGRAFAERLLPVPVAWDVYLFYPPGARWDDHPPRPMYWSHQRGRVETAHFHPREQLFEELHKAMGELAKGESARGRAGVEPVAVAD